MSELPLGAVEEDEAHCRRCGLWQTRTQVVVGRGSRAAQVMFLAEAPGREEDRSGLGFQGAAGTRFNEMLAFLGLDRDHIWLANAVRCRPTVDGKRNRAPRPEEIHACRHWLVRDIHQIRPRFVVTMGRIAFETLTQEAWDPSRRASPLHVDEFNLTAFALYHPAYLIYRRDLFPTYRRDLVQLRQLLTQSQVPIGVAAGSWAFMEDTAD